MRFGKFCSVAYGVKIGLNPHPINYVTTSPLFYMKRGGLVNEDLYDEYNEKVIIEHDVWIGANVLVKTGVRIGTGSIIAAGAVVTRDVPPYAIVGGVPSKIIKYRFERDVIDELLKSKWWEKDIQILKKHYRKITNPIEFLNSFNK
ncbi:CatB-related O-acetyltransferase [Marinitoga sp. 1155]|uniref:CatB-related O-acetyltransferase n=1 Tax=Marinitoga sp. 1155 TaxID=1428448 RepID=UPI00065788B5|nr:CatB-related O-acetyltransferase [Marinitoga sp. 1155]KLO22764.1 hypothetical protein X274_07685 [Marinitoga sp. 1155]